MAAIRSKEIRQYGSDEFNSKLVSLRKELMKLRSQKSSGTNPEYPGRIRVLRRTIARMLTIQKEKGGAAKKK